MRQSVLLFVVFVGSVSAQEPPYDKPLPVAPPYFRVRYESSMQPGELVYAVSYTVWIPPQVKTLRGLVVHQHGCGEGSCRSGQTGAFDLHWQALAKKHDCALMSPVYEQPEKANCQLWCDPRNGSDAVFQKSLVDLADKSGHPELATVPWALWGHSGGGHWAGGMTLLHPERVAAAWLRSGVPPIAAVEGKPAPYAISEAACGVPVMCNLGTKEGVTDKESRFAGVWPANEAFFLAVRAKGGLIGVAIDPLSSHDCGNQRYLAIPWLDACLTARLPAEGGGRLKPISADDGWLVPLDNGDGNIVNPVPVELYSAAIDKSVWLPNKTVAFAWKEYVTDTAVTDTSPPPAPTNVRVDGNVLTWSAEADLESGLARFIIERDGEVLANVPEQGKNPFGRPVFQNLQYSDTPSQPLVEMKYTDTTAEAGKTYQYRVIAVNTVGLRSK
jgi:pimeloyl-ACP methyl ester carboxylesterase